MNDDRQENRPERYSSIDAAERYQAKIASKSPLKLIGQKLELAMLKRALSSIEGTSILDCPCGTGRIDLLLREKFTHIVGADSSASMLKVYQDNDSQRVGSEEDIFNLSYHDHAFDWAISHRLFHHFHTDEERVSMLKSLARVTTQGIVFYAWVNTPFSQRGKNTASGRRSLPLANIKENIRAAGLEITSTNYALWPFSPKVMIVCKKI